MTPEDLARYQWLTSQKIWHIQRSLKIKWPTNRWHKRQIRWFNKQIRQLPGLFSYIVAKTLAEYSEQIASNVLKNNALLTRMLHR